MLKMVESNYDIYRNQLLGRRATSQRITLVLALMVAFIIAGTIIIKLVYYRKIVGYLKEKKVVWYLYIILSHLFIRLTLNVAIFFDIFHQLLYISFEFVKFISSHSIRIVEVLVDIDQEVGYNFIFDKPMIILEDVNIAESNNFSLKILFCNWSKVLKQIRTNLAKLRCCVQINDFNWLIFNQKVLIVLAN